MKDIREVIQKQSWLSWGISQKLTQTLASLLILFATGFTDTSLINDYYETQNAEFLSLV